MTKHKRTALGRETTRIAGKVERILEAGEKLRAALRSERWVERTGSPGAAQRWLHTRAATDRAEAAYREAIEECYRLAEDLAGHGPRQNAPMGRETRPILLELGPVRRLFASL